MDKFISDTHLSHKNIIKFERQQFKTIHEHDQFIKHIIQSNVKPNDTLYVLGDVGELSTTNIQFWKSLPCKTILIRGNHDKQKTKLLDAFDTISDVPIFYNNRVLLSHEPLPVTNETINIHGHLHGAYLNKNNYKNISIHMVNYKILTEKDIEKLVMMRPKISKRFLYEWYAENYIFTTEKNEIVYNENGTIDIEQSRLQLFNKEPMASKLKMITQKFLTKYPSYESTNIENKIKIK